MIRTCFVFGAAVLAVAATRPLAAQPSLRAQWITAPITLDG